MLLFCVLHPCFFSFYIKKYVVHLAFKYNRDYKLCSSYICGYESWCSNTYRRAIRLHASYIGRDTIEKKKIDSPHCRQAYVFNIDFISHLIPNTFIIYLFEKPIYFHHNAYIKTSDWIESQACGLVLSWCRNDILLPHFSSSITMSNIPHIP